MIYKCPTFQSNTGFQLSFATASKQSSTCARVVLSLHSGGNSSNEKYPLATVSEFSENSPPFNLHNTNTLQILYAYIGVL